MRSRRCIDVTDTWGRSDDHLNARLQDTLNPGPHHFHVGGVDTRSNILCCPHSQLQCPSSSPHAWTTPFSVRCPSKWCSWKTEFHATANVTCPPAFLPGPAVDAELVAGIVVSGRSTSLPSSPVVVLNLPGSVGGIVVSNAFNSLTSSPQHLRWEVSVAGAGPTRLARFLEMPRDEFYTVISGVICAGRFNNIRAPSVRLEGQTAWCVCGSALTTGVGRAGLDLVCDVAVLFHVASEELTIHGMAGDVTQFLRRHSSCSPFSMIGLFRPLNCCHQFDPPTPLHHWTTGHFLVNVSWHNGPPFNLPCNASRPPPPSTSLQSMCRGSPHVSRPPLPSTNVLLMYRRSLQHNTRVLRLVNVCSQNQDHPFPSGRGFRALRHQVSRSRQPRLVTSHRGRPPPPVPTICPPPSADSRPPGSDRFRPTPLLANTALGQYHFRPIPL